MKSCACQPRNSWMFIIRPKTIRVRWAATSLIAVAVVASVYISLWYLRVVPAWKASLARQQSEVVQRAAEEIKTFLNERIREIHALNELGQFWNMKPESQKRFLDRLLKIDPVIEELSIANPAGQELLRLSRLRVFTDSDLRVVGGEESFRQAIAGNIFIGPVFHAMTNEPFVTVAVPIRIAGDEVRGVIIAHLAIKALWEAISKIKVGRSGLLWVVDPRGILIAHPDYSKVLLGLDLSNDLRVQRLFRGGEKNTGFGDCPGGF